MGVEVGRVLVESSGEESTETDLERECPAHQHFQNSIHCSPSLPEVEGWGAGPSEPFMRDSPAMTWPLRMESRSRKAGRRGGRRVTRPGECCCWRGPWESQGIQGPSSLLPLLAFPSRT